MHRAAVADGLARLKRAAVEAPFGISQEFFTLAAQAVRALVVVGAIVTNHGLDRSFLPGDSSTVSVSISNIHGSGGRRSNR